MIVPNPLSVDAPTAEELAALETERPEHPRQLAIKAEHERRVAEYYAAARRERGAL